VGKRSRAPVERSTPPLEHTPARPGHHTDTRAREACTHTAQHSECHRTYVATQKEIRPGPSPPPSASAQKSGAVNGVANPADQHAKPLLQHPRNPSIWASLTPARLTARAVGRVVPPSAILSVQHVTGPRAPFLPCGGHRNQRPSSAFGVFHVFERAGGWHLRSSACGPACGRPSRGSACRRS
jgi:hypothetical protein